MWDEKRQQFKYWSMRPVSSLVFPLNYLVFTISIARIGVPPGHVKMTQWPRNFDLKLRSVGRKCQPSEAS